MILAALCCNACADTTLTARHFAVAHGFEAQIIPGREFLHQVFRSHTSADELAILHVYLEGDGSPYLGATWISADPTPHHPMMLRLMSQDPTPSVYIGRPCYFGLQHAPPCNPLYWTVRRFSPEVLNSTIAAICSEVTRAGARNVELYGHSGGGTLAVLIAARLSIVSRVITIGPNLDIAAWAARHGYAPLVGSLNPATLREHYDKGPVVHLVGSGDTQTPPALVEEAVREGVGGRVVVVRGFTHECCWERIWRTVVTLRPDQDITVLLAQ